jgi:hypothetical protein
VSDWNTRPDHAFLQLRHQQCAAGDIFRGPVDCPFQCKNWQVQTVERRLRVEEPSVRSARVLSAGADRLVDRLAVSVEAIPGIGEQAEFASSLRDCLAITQGRPA